VWGVGEFGGGAPGTGTLWNTSHYPKLGMYTHRHKKGVQSLHICAVNNANVFTHCNAHERTHNNTSTQSMPDVNANMVVMLLVTQCSSKVQLELHLVTHVFSTTTQSWTLQAGLKYTYECAQFHASNLLDPSTAVLQTVLSLLHRWQKIGMRHIAHIRMYT